MRTSRKRERGRVLGYGMFCPIVDDQRVVDPQAHAVVAGGKENPTAGGAGLDLAGPANRVVAIWRNIRSRRSAFPILGKVDCRIDSRASQSGVVDCVEIFTEQASDGGRTIIVEDHAGGGGRCNLCPTCGAA